MLELSTECKSVPFKLDDEPLVMTEFNIQDIDRLIELQEPLLGENNLGKINDLMITRVMCSVKKPDGQYYWSDGLESFTEKKYPQNMISKLVEECNKLNPMRFDTLDTKKKSS